MPILTQLDWLGKLSPSVHPQFDLTDTLQLCDLRHDTFNDTDGLGWRKWPVSRRVNQHKILSR